MANFGHTCGKQGFVIEVGEGGERSQAVTVMIMMRMTIERRYFGSVLMNKGINTIIL